MVFCVQALIQLDLMQRMRGIYLRNAIRNARNAAVNNFGMDAARLVVCT